MRDVIKFRALGAVGHHCVGRYNDCPYLGYDSTIPKGTVMLEVMGSYRFCPSCAKKVLPDILTQVELCISQAEGREQKVELYGINLLRSNINDK